MLLERQSTENSSSDDDALSSPPSKAQKGKGKASASGAAKAKPKPKPKPKVLSKGGKKAAGTKRTRSPSVKLAAAVKPRGGHYGNPDGDKFENMFFQLYADNQAKKSGAEQEKRIDSLTEQVNQVTLVSHQIEDAVSRLTTLVTRALAPGPSGS